MVHDRVRYVRAPESTQLKSVREIDVFVDGKECAIEPAQFLECIATNQERRAAGPKHIAAAACLAHRSAMAPFERPAPTRDAVSGAVDNRRIVHEHDARGRKCHFRIAVERAPQRGKPARLGSSIVVEKRQVVAAGRLCAGIVACGKARVAPEREDAHGRK